MGWGDRNCVHALLEWNLWDFGTTVQYSCNMEGHVCCCELDPPTDSIHGLGGSLWLTLPEPRLQLEIQIFSICLYNGFIFNHTIKLAQRCKIYQKSLNLPPRGLLEDSNTRQHPRRDAAFLNLNLEVKKLPRSYHISTSISPTHPYPKFISHSHFKPPLFSGNSGSLSRPAGRRQ